MVLDLLGNIALVLSVVSLFLLILGLPLVQGTSTPKNLKMHGYLTIVALAMETVLVFAVMVPSFFVNFHAILELTPLSAANTWLHVGLGLFAEASGFVYVILWLWSSVSQMYCYAVKKYMMPTFIVWIVAIIGGAAIHILQLF